MKRRYKDTRNKGTDNFQAPITQDTNAELSDRLTYTTYIPLINELYLALGEDIGETSKYLIALSSSVNGLEERDIVLIIQEKIQELHGGSLVGPHFF